MTRCQMDHFQWSLLKALHPIKPSVAVVRSENYILAMKIPFSDDLHR